jgi:hypothetical protein
LCTIDPASRPPLAAVMRIFFVSTFVGTFLPASVGGDAVRAYSLSKLNVRSEDAVASVFMDRILGVASLLVMAVVGLTLAREPAANRAIVMALAAAGVVCTATLLVIFSRGSRYRLLEALQKYAAYPGQLVNVLVCSIGVQVLRIVQAYYLGRGLGIDAPLGAYFAFVPLILLVMLLPVTINGIGTSQAAFVWFFGHVGVPAPEAFALSVLFVALGIIGNLPGAVLFVVDHGQPRVDRMQSSLGRTVR